MFVSGVLKDAFSLWLNQNVQDAEKLAEIAISSAQRRLRAAKKVVRKKLVSGPALPGKLADCGSQDLEKTELFLVEGDSAGVQQNKRVIANIKRFCRYVGKF
ncbi:DNA topoisomerase IV subunit B [Haemophilus influenzae]|uniref:DNA topoisomerase (ATP-hydrolyzing) n=1 Tax=Haemophilus influenzae TaxID=727 RepID=A0A2X1RFI1_HAEIF|nr:DNA topoisomerase IV subunit B [Haemophilus influenzae]